MAMVESHRPIGGFGIDVPPYPIGPHFSNPWHGEHSPDQSPSHMYPIPSPFNHPVKAETSMTHQMAYPIIPISSAAAAAAEAGANALNIHFQHTPELQALNTDVMHSSPSTYRSSSEGAFPPTPASASISYHPSVPSSTVQTNHMAHFDAPSYISAVNQAQELDRRISCMSQPTINATNFFGTPIELARNRHASVMDMSRHMTGPHISFDDTFDHSRSMAAPSHRPMSRAMYSRESVSESMAYAGSLSHTPSVSSGYLSYPGSMSESLTDMSSCGSESYDMHGARLLPRPSGLQQQLSGSLLPMGVVAPPPHSMMGQFSSKIASSSQKKHKCKVCDKRFTRPSSLQTHMYSHTGEKRKLDTPSMTKS